MEAERLRFSRDLHDLLGHTLSLIVVKAEVARRYAGQPRPDPAAAAREAGEIEHIGRRALAEVRQAVAGYRERSFAGELDAARTALADAGVEVTVRAAQASLPPRVDDLFGWVVREAATNVVRHSQARHCYIEMSSHDGRAMLEVRDDGMGTAAVDKGRGLAGLVERVTEVGGHLVAGPSEPGWRLAATIPLDPGAALPEQS